MTDQRMKPSDLRSQIARDRGEGSQPFLVVGTAGSVSTGAVDPLPEIASICRELDVWFHVDGAYGALAAQIRERLRILADLPRQTRSPSIRTNGCTRRSRPGVFSCAGRNF